jgi:hypothetical protein
LPASISGMTGKMKSEPRWKHGVDILKTFWRRHHGWELSFTCRQNEHERRSQLRAHRPNIADFGN